MEFLPQSKDKELHLSEDDFEMFTCGAKILNSDRRISRSDFIVCVRLELNSYAHRKISNAMKSIEDSGKDEDIAICLSQKITMTNFHERRMKKQDLRIPSLLTNADQASDDVAGSEHSKPEDTKGAGYAFVPSSHTPPRGGDAGQKIGHGEAIDWVQVESKIGSIVDSVVQSRLQVVLEEMDRKESRMEFLLKRYQRQRSRWCRDCRT